MDLAAAVSGDAPELDEESLRRKNQIRQLRKKATALQAYNNKLREQKRINEKDTNEFVQYFQHEIAKRDSELLELKAIIEEQRSKRSAQYEQLKFEFEERVKELDKETKCQRSDYSARVIFTNNKLTDMWKQQQLREKHEEALRIMREELHAKDREQTLELTQMERSFIAKKAEIQDSLNITMSEIHRNAMKNANKDLLKRSLQVREETVRLLALTQKLEKKKADLRAKNKRLRIGESIDKEQNNVARALNQKRKLKLKRKTEIVRKLEFSLGDLVREFDNERDGNIRAFNKELEAAQLDLAAVKELVRLKHAELTKMREKSKKILTCREEMERFFFDALDKLRKDNFKEIVDQKIDMKNVFVDHSQKDEGKYKDDSNDTDSKINENKINENKINENKNDENKNDESETYPEDELKAGDFPEWVQSGFENNGMQGPYSNKVEWSDLSAEEKEKLIRLLYAQVSNVDIGE